MSTTTDHAVPTPADTPAETPAETAADTAGSAPHRRRRWPWLVAGGLVAAAVAGQGGYALAGVVAQRTTSSAVGFDGVESVVVVSHHCGGDITVTGGDAADGSSADLTAQDRWSFRRPSRTTVVEDGVLRVALRCPVVSVGLGSAVDLALRVPAGVPVGLETGAGDVVLDGVSGATSVDTGAGDVDVRGATGGLRVSTGAGDVSGRGISGDGGDVVAETGAGDVDLSFSSPPLRLSAATGAGDVDVAVPEGGRGYAVDATSGFGEVTVGVPRDDASDRALVLRSDAGDVSVTAR